MNGEAMTLGRLIERLEAAALIDPNKACVGFANPHSYRGYYERVAFEPTGNTTVGNMLAAAKSALGATYTGYKGGEFTMDADSLVHVACWGQCDGLDFDAPGMTEERLDGMIGKEGARRIKCPYCDGSFELDEAS